jgi:hypothetical protein
MDLGSSHDTVLHYRLAMAKSPTDNPAWLRSTITLISRRFGRKKYAKTFNNKSSLPSALMQKNQR